MFPFKILLAAISLVGERPGPKKAQSHGLVTMNVILQIFRKTDAPSNSFSTNPELDPFAVTSQELNNKSKFYFCLLDFYK